MDKLIESFYRGTGYFILWVLGFFGIPLLITFFFGLFSDDEDYRKLVMGVSMFLYLVATAIFLILL